MTLHELKQAQLAKRLELLVAQYEAAGRQRNQTLNAADKVTLDEQLRQFEQDIAAVENQLAALESGAPIDQSAQADRATIDTGGGAYVGQNVQVGGDFIGRDQIIINITSGDASSQMAVDRRAAEQGYLKQLIQQYEYWAEKYTPLAGITEVRKAAADGPRLDLPNLFMPTGFEKLTAHGFGERQEIKREPVDDLLAAVTQHPRLVVLGDPGSGKTTTLWRLTYDLAVRAQADADAPLPLFVPLGGYTGDEAPSDYAAESFGDLAPYLSDYLQEQRVVLLLDALNEMPQADYKARVGHIQALLDKHPAVSAVVTCRELDYVETLNLAKLEIKPLDVDHQRAYVHRYLGEQDGERLFWQLAGGDQILEMWNGWQAAGGTWEQFWTADDIPGDVYNRTSVALDNQWKSFRADGLPELLELGRNPFMLVMLSQVYAAGQGVLPQKSRRSLCCLCRYVADA